MMSSQITHISFYCLVVFTLFLFSSCKDKVDEKLMPQEKAVEKKLTSEVPEKSNVVVKEFSIQEESKIEESQEGVKTEITPTKVKKQSDRKKSENAAKKAVVAKPKPIKKGILSFDHTEYDFGFIEVGEIVDHTFRFINKGNAPINISNAVASCGCTTPVFPFLPIEPGKSGNISVRFNSKDRLGGQKATVTVYSDAKQKEFELTLSGVIRSEIVSPAEFVDSIK